VTNEDGCYANVDEGVFLVADGVGGNRGGALASQLIVDTVPLFLAMAHQNGRFKRETLPELIRQALYATQSAMADIAMRQSSVAKMGSTVVLGVVSEGVLSLTHLGDSRAYLIRGGAIRQLTKDHSIVQALVDCGAITADEASQHPYRHVILESIGASKLPVVEVASHKLLPNDRLLFTTDGLTNVVDEELLGWIVMRHDDPQTAAYELVRQALNEGTHDNATCVVVHFEPRCEMDVP
jgi:protein phosphatase